MLWRASFSRALWALDSYGPPRTRLVRPLLRALGIFGGVHWTPPACDPHVHRAAGGYCTHAARTFSHLYVPGVMAVVPGSSLPWHEAGRELARIGEIFSQVRCGYRSRALRRLRVFCLESLAE